MMFLAFLCVCLAHGVFSQVHDISGSSGALLQQINDLEKVVQTLGNQVMQERLFVEERVRSEGMSGLKQVRQYHEGTSPYFTDTHIGSSPGAIHDHSEYDNTFGMGEFIAVMNGIEFRTRHNDYKLRMPSQTSSQYQATELIDFPDVPPEVSSKATVQEQVAEMREWFRAFKEQDTSIRDYRPYFKPNLCIVEGAWTLPDSPLEEPFQSDRHHVDATSWDDLVEKIQFTTYTGGKSNDENFAYLPTKLYSMEGNKPKIAQWNYRIVCHPLSFDLPTSYFKVQNDMSKRLARRAPFDNLAESRIARFKINEFGSEREVLYTLLDRMMYEFPGLDNYQVNLTEETFGLKAFDIDQGGPLNAGFYSRWYKYGVEGAMGVEINHRGFNDENLWVAVNTQPHIMPMSVTDCTTGVCKKISRRVSYAVPLEVVYTSPLYKWNPHNVAFHKGDPDSDPLAMSVKAGGRNGGQTADLAFNGTNFKTFYRTPAEFFKDNKVEFDYADTAKDSAGVLDTQGNVRLMTASGPRIVLPNIEGVGVVRLRYPIFPVHSEGGTVGEELLAVKDVLMKLNKYAYLLEEVPSGAGNVSLPDVHFILAETHRDPPGNHAHEFFLPREDVERLRSGTDLTIKTSVSLAHLHELVIHYDPKGDFFVYLTCDGVTTCWDGHATRLTTTN